MPKEIVMSSGQTVLVSDEHYDWLNQWKWKAIKSKTRVYAGRSVRSKESPSGYATVLMHRLVVDAPRGLQVDHINSNTLDNRIENLRVCTSSENNTNRNCPRGTVSKHRGVTEWASGKYRYFVARIKKDGYKFHLGYFKDEEEAARAYDAKAKELYGEFAVLNFPTD